MAEAPHIEKSVTPELWETPEGWQRLKPLFYPAMEKPPEERARFVSEVCSGDKELRDALLRLIQANEESLGRGNGPLVDLHGLFSGSKSTFQEGELIWNQFRIVRLIGSGGMGEVYEAIDLNLGRIALKAIRPEIALDPHVIAHFKKEVQLARRFSGPHVCRIHALHVSSDTTAGPHQTFLTMEYLDGITLADKIRESGPLPWREVKAIALEICEGLRVMHEAGIIHRDLKSRNVMLADRNGSMKAVVMDFGLAREVRTTTSETATDVSVEQSVAGTIDYMAPEQFAGDTLTPAADIFALGVVMYELATGRQPFPSGTILQAAIRRGQRPARPSSIQKGLPHRCDEIIGRCLEFDPKKRYGSVKVVEEEIQDRLPAKLRRTWLRIAAGFFAVVALISGLLLVPAIRERVEGILLSSREKHIAVLPFDIAGNDPQTQALGDGLMDSLTGKLSNLDTTNQTLWVVPASEVRSRNVHDASSALKEFGATIVVQGSFERNEPNAHLRLTLVDPRKMREIGFADVENAAGDLASMEDSAVTRLGRLMNISVGAESATARPSRQGNAAYEDYLTGLGYFQRYDKPGNIQRAIAALEQAVTTDPEFALGFAQLAQVYVMRYRLDPDHRWIEQAELYCGKAVALDDRLSSTYIALAQVHELTGKYDLAIQEFKRALSFNPRDADAVVGIARSYKKSGRTSEAEDAYIKAAALRPDDWTGYNALGVFYEDIGRPRDAIIQYRKALALTPDNAGLYTNLGVAYMDLDDPAMLRQAEEALKRSIAINPTFVAYGNLGFLYLREHRFDESIKASQKALQLNPQSFDVWSNLTSAYEWQKLSDKARDARESTITVLEQALKLNPQDTSARATLAVMLARDGLRDKALDAAQISLALSPADQYVFSQVADAYELLGDRAKSAYYLSQAFAHGLTKAQLSGDPYIQEALSSRDLRAQSK